MWSECRWACRPDVVKRALGYAVVVGAVLITINHGDALARGEMGRVRLLKMALTVVVPYLVSTLSSIGAMRQAEAGSQFKALRVQSLAGAPPGRGGPVRRGVPLGTHCRPRWSGRS